MGINDIHSSNLTLETTLLSQTNTLQMDWLELSGKILGGLCIFMYGTRILSQSLKNTAGENMKEILGTFSNNPILGLFSGLIVASTLQSSALVGVMIVNFVSSGYMTLQQSINILLGAGIGTTITSQILAFNISKYMLFVVAIGFFILAFAKSKNVQQFGNGMFALGLTFHGISTMSSAMVPLRAYQPFIDLLVGLSNPILGILVSAVFTALIQSSTAAVGLIQALASQQLISVRTAVVFVLGGKKKITNWFIFPANIGTTFTSVLAAIGSTHEAIRVAIFNMFTKVIAVFILLPFIGGFASGIESTSGDRSRQIANAHTFFNVMIAMMFFPFGRRISNFLTNLY